MYNVGVSLFLWIGWVMLTVMCRIHMGFVVDSKTFAAGTLT